MLTDSHAHLQWKDFDADRLQVVDRALQSSVDCIINIGYNLKGSQDAVRLATERKGLYATVGFHPHEAKNFDDDVVSFLRTLCRNPSVVAIGEIGLDYYRNLSPKPVQRKAFEAQINLAREMDLPIVVHDRDAHQEVLQTLKDYRGKIRGVIHCFSGSLEMARQCVGLQFMISIAGPVTFPNARKLHELAKEIPLSHLLLETDCPWLAPLSKRGRRNEPAYVFEIAEKIAKIRNMSLEDLAKATSDNAKRLFGIS